jgi:hypothetical protein
MEVIGTRFTGRDRHGDFAWMIEQPDFQDVLFVFNDNEEEFRAHRSHARGARRCHAGGGNAVVRPYQCVDPPHAAGVPTGSQGHGYEALHGHVRAVIDDALAAIAALATTGGYQRIMYSASADDPDDLGTGIFQVDEAVRRYIVQGLRRLASTSG